MVGENDFAAPRFCLAGLSVGLFPWFWPTHLLMDTRNADLPSNEPENVLHELGPFLLVGLDRFVQQHLADLDSVGGARERKTSIASRVGRGTTLRGLPWLSRDLPLKPSEAIIYLENSHREKAYALMGSRGPRAPAGARLSCPSFPPPSPLPSPIVRVGARYPWCRSRAAVNSKGA